MEVLTQNYDLDTVLHLFCSSQQKIIKFNSITEVYSYLPFNCMQASIIQNQLIIYINPENEFTLPLFEGIQFLRIHIDNTKLLSVENFPKLSEDTVSFYSRLTIVYRTSFNLDFISDEPRKIGESAKHVDYAYSRYPETLIRFILNF